MIVEKKEDLERYNNKGWKYALIGFNYEKVIEEKEKNKTWNKTKEEIQVEKFCAKENLPYLFVSSKLFRNVSEIFEISAKIHKGNFPSYLPSEEEILFCTRKNKPPPPSDKELNPYSHFRKQQDIGSFHRNHFENCFYRHKPKTCSFNPFSGCFLRLD